MASKIGKNEWKIVYVVVGLIDFIQFVIIEVILVWVFGVGVLINEVLDVVVGILLALYFQLRGVNLFKRINRLASMVGMEALEELTGGVAQLWILDVWYIHGDVKREEAESDSQQEQESLLNNSIRQPLYKDGMRQPESKQGQTNLAVRNTSGIRVPNGTVLKSN